MQRKYKQRAIDRAALLWEYHKAHGRLLREDVERLTQATWATVYETFRNHKVSAPPVWDSNLERTRRKAEKLTAMAKALGHQQLTQVEAGEALEMKPALVTNFVHRMDHYGIDHPPIVLTDPPPQTLPDGPEGMLDYYHYPEGLQAMSKRIGPEGETIYMLR